jgi:hypothetical protein
MHKVTSFRLGRPGVFVADGYGNKRIIVFDAGTGAFKRMWGAFGAMPIDDPPAPAGSPQQPRGPDGASQFVPPVHAAKVSTDGLVYVADRGGRRVQVFTIAGKFVNRASPHGTRREQSRSVTSVVYCASYFPT